MARDQAANRHVRIRIAHIAARLIAVDGIDDFALAKRKAAQEAGAGDTRHLPSNEEVQAQLRTYLQLHQADEHAARLGHLRDCALQMMRALRRFNPYLSGPVLKGNVGRYASINLHLFTDDAKGVEFHMLNSKFEYQIRDRHMQRGKLPDTMPVYSVRTETADFEISVVTQEDLRNRLKASKDGRRSPLASLASIEAGFTQESNGLSA